MTESANPGVQEFINKIKLIDETKYQILQLVRSIVIAHIPDADERMMYGGIIFSLQDDFGGVFAYINHVSLEFGYGYKLSDPASLLEGKGKFRRHLKFKTIQEIEAKKTEDFVKQVCKLENQ